MPKVLNRHGMYKPIPEGAVFVGRPSKWGNPFKIGVDGTREETIKSYKYYLMYTPKLMDSLHELKGKDLVCYCAPLPCHADVLLEWANKE